MAFQDDLARHADQIRNRLPHINGEEATKQALVVPFLHVLATTSSIRGRSDPNTLPTSRPRSTASSRRSTTRSTSAACPSCLFECKPVGALLEDHGGQLSRYFNATPSVRVAMITNGVHLRVYTDLQTPNVMDATPWLDIDLRALKTAEVEALKRFRKVDFTPEEILSSPRRWSTTMR